MSHETRVTSRDVITLEGVAVRHGRQPVLDGVSLRVAAGEIHVLLGRNGSGKSTLLRCLLGLHRPSVGTLRVFGRDPWADRVAVLARVGAVPETPDAPRDLSVTQLVAFTRSFHTRWDEPATRQRLDRFAIPLDARFGRLSKGQQGAVMLTLALGHGPELLVLDDPTLGLDIVAKDEIFAEVIGDLADRGTTVLMTTHEVALAEGLATHVAILHGGRVAVQDRLEALKQAHGASLEQIYRSAIAPAGRAA